MTGHCGSLPLLYMQPIMAHTSSKSLAELSTDEHEATFVNVTQMLSSLTHTTKVEVAGQPNTTPSTTAAAQQAHTAPTVQPSVAPTTPKQAAARSPTAATCPPVEDNCNHRCLTTDWQNCCHTSPIWLCQ